MKKFITFLTVTLFSSINISYAQDNVVDKLIEDQCRELIHSNLPKTTIYKNHLKIFYDSNKKIIENSIFKACNENGYLKKYFSMNQLQKSFLTDVSIDTNNPITPIFFKKENVYFNHRYLVFVRSLPFEELRLHTLELKFAHMDNSIYVTFLNESRAKSFLNALYNLENNKLDKEEE